MKHSIRYVNGRGDVIDFTGPLPYRMVTGDLFDYEWDYTSADDYRLRGERITAFRQVAMTKEIEVDVFAGTETAYIEAINNLHDIADYDVGNLKPGRLYADGSYLNCYIIGSKKEQWENPVLYMSVTLTVVAEFPAWWTEEEYNFAVIEHDTSNSVDEFVLTPDVSSGQIDYPFDYAMADATVRTIDNAFAYKASDFILRIYGPCHNPYITLNGVAHSIEIDLEVQEMVEVNSYERTIRKRNVLFGTEQNVFGSGGEQVFDSIPAGVFSVMYSGDFAFDLIVLQRRAEPLWI